MLETIALRDDGGIGAFSWKMPKEVVKFLQDARVALRESSQRMGLPEEHWDRAFEELVGKIECNIRGSLLLISVAISRGPLVVDDLRLMGEMTEALGSKIIIDLAEREGEL